MTDEVFAMLTKSEFEDIVLTKLELTELKQFAHGIELSHCYFHALLEHGLVEPCADLIANDGTPIPFGGYSITEKGIRYLEYKWMFGWRCILKYVADNLIAFLALIVAIVSLFTP